LDISYQISYLTCIHIGNLMQDIGKLDESVSRPDDA
jgi:hypothetical protein